MKKILFLSALFLFVVNLINPRLVLADTATCLSYGGKCGTTFPEGGSEMWEFYMQGSEPLRCDSQGGTSFPLCFVLKENGGSNATCEGKCFSGTRCPESYRRIVGGSCISAPQNPKVCCETDPDYSPPSEGGRLVEDITCEGTDDINTAIGCIPVSNTKDFIAFVLGWAIGIGGGIAFLLIVFAGFMMMTSTGKPERLQAGKELLVSAIAGLIMIIFSVFILRIIGVDILGIIRD